MNPIGIHSPRGGFGFDNKILRKIIAIRKVADHERKEQEEILELYKRALGME